MTATLKDMGLLATDPTFQSRVQAAMISAAISITTEAWTVAFHRERQTYAVQILNAPSLYMPLFAGSVATDAATSTAATGGGTYVALTTANLATQAALATDVNINNAVSAQFNSFFRTPAS